VRSGETVRLLGPNGAGKTTTLSMMSGISKPDRGSVSFLGQRVHQDANALKKRVGLVPQDLALFEELSAWANLELFGGLYGLSGAVLATRQDSRQGASRRRHTEGFRRRGDAGVLER
jgi:ABC-2 type transport system ATP-binding protein